MPDYNSEIVDILLVLGECRGNYRRAAALYYQRFPRRRHHPNDSMIGIIERRERRRIRRRNRQRRDLNNIKDVRFIAVLVMVAVNPHVSTRQIESELGIPRNTASKYYDL